MKQSQTDSATRKSKTVLVVGAAGDIGAATCSLLLRGGYRVIAAVRDASEAKRIATLSGAPKILRVDLGNADLAGKAFSDELGARPLRAAVNCAGVAPFGPLETASLDRLRRAFEINVVANQALFQACMPGLRKTRGRFICIGSMVGRIPVPFLGPYVASKFALEGLADVMRIEARKWGVEVVLVEPGRVLTNMGRGQLLQIEAEMKTLPPRVRKLYGPLYQAFHRRSSANEDSGLGMKADVVARVIVNAIEARVPKTRYLIGRDAKSLVDLRERLSDRGYDAAIRKLYAGAL